jgi:hypothetical protein
MKYLGGERHISRELKCDVISGTVVHDSKERSLLKSSWQFKEDFCDVIIQLLHVAENLWLLQVSNRK